ncbi:hypothetical protein M3223_16770 [Paenibacillus pasadenensis]|uniref:hypothetical protein n=1 Tax=Paenibacillus pasadenensis TaxID=217090 RepID=UPI00203FF157|nr:hypothetical protein [Paenibacillus pasadenensis]MCM3749010.1 hypothetical protein [Paenibacillus pasadenensis]
MSKWKRWARTSGIGVVVGMMLAGASPVFGYSVVKPSQSPLPASGAQQQQAAAPSSRSDEALLVYGREWLTQEGRERLTELYRMLRGTHSKVSLVRGGDFTEGQLRDAELIVAAGGAGEEFLKSLPSSLPGSGRQLLALTTEQGFAAAEAQLAAALDENGKSSPEFFMLTDVNPFLDMDELMSKGKWLHERGIPFWMELRPIFINTETESMQRYYDAVRKLQEYGGLALLGTLGGWTPPDEWESFRAGYEVTGATNSDEPEQLSGQAWLAYVQQGIYPAGFSGPPDLMFDREWEKVLRHGSLFVEQSEWQGYTRDNESGSGWEGTYVPFEDQAEQRGHGLLPDASPAVLALSASMPEESFRNLLNDKLRSGSAYADPALTDSFLHWNDRQLVRRQGVLTLDGVPAVWQPPEPPPDTSSLPPETAGDQLSTVNKGIKMTMSVLFVVSVLVVGFFVAAFVVGRQINRRKHLR